MNDRFTMIRSMSYTPVGLFNHTAAIYQMLTGYTTDKVSASGQLEPPSPKDFPNFGSNLIRLKPVTAPMLPFVMLPRPLRTIRSMIRRLSAMGDSRQISCTASSTYLTRRGSTG